MDRWFNTAAFQIADRGTFGNLGRNTLTAPGVHNWDFSLTKNTQVSEGKNVQFRAEIFNIAIILSSPGPIPTSVRRSLEGSSQHHSSRDRFSWD